MVAHFVNAVIRHIGDGDAQFGGGVHGDVVHAHAVAADDAAALCGAHHGRGDLGEAGHNGVAVGGQAGQGGFGGVGGFHYGDAVGAEAGGQGGAFRLGGGPDEVGDEDAEGRISRVGIGGGHNW